MDVKDLYKKERKRVLGYLARKRREGYYIGDINVPKIPKRITEGSVRKLLKMTPREMRKKIYYVSAAGELANINNKGKVKRLRREDYQEGGVYAMKVLENFYAEIEQTGNDRAYSLVNDWMSSWIARDGAEMVAEALEEAANKGVRLEVYAYGSPRLISQAVLRFARETFRLSGEYSEAKIEEMVEEIEESFEMI